MCDLCKFTQKIQRDIRLKCYELDYYFLVSNRKLTGKTEAIIRNYISAQAGIPVVNIFLAGVEQLELWLKRYPDIVKLAKIDPIDSPLNVAPNELAEIIEALVSHKEDLKGSLPVARTSLAEKDRLNQMTEDYSKKLRRRYLSHTNSIQDFLADPLNEDLQKKYDTDYPVTDYGLFMLYNLVQSAHA